MNLTFLDNFTGRIAKLKHRMPAVQIDHKCRKKHTELNLFRAFE